MCLSSSPQNLLQAFAHFVALVKDVIEWAKYNICTFTMNKYMHMVKPSKGSVDPSFSFLFRFPPSDAIYVLDTHSKTFFDIHSYWTSAQYHSIWQNLVEELLTSVE